MSDKSTPHLYLIGIGGVGMLWIADLALSRGWQVSGSDLVSSPGTQRLQAAGATIHYGVDPTAIPADVTEAVINSAITPSSPSYPELAELERRKIPYVKRAVWLGKITRQMTTIAVCGAHGKTTTTAMIGWILEKAGLDPTVFVGGTVNLWGGTRIGKSQYLVIEADEYDRSFHQFTPQMAVVLNIDLDHEDYYTGGIAEIEHSYRRFLRNLPTKTGLVVGYGKDGRIRKVCRGFSYRFRWYDEEHLWPGLRLPVPGKHLELNATAAARIAHELGVSQEVIKEALATFPGVGRRFEHLGVWEGVEVYDDYAHHPQELAATLSTLAKKFPGKKTTLIFQPHQKARTKNLLKEFGRAFDESPPSRLILAPIYQVAGREEDIAVTSGDVASEIKKKLPAGLQLEVAEDESQLEQLAREAAKNSEVLVVAGAGSIRRFLENWMRGSDGR